MPTALTIAQISDCHLFADKYKAGYNHIQPYFSLEAILSDLQQQQFDLLLVTGDISGDYSLQSYQHFLSLWQNSDLNCCLKLLPGNHDCIETMSALFAPEQLWFDVVEYDHWQIHLLNTKGQGTLGELAAEPFLQLQHRIDSSGKHQLLAMHHHPVDSHSWMDKHHWFNKQDFCDWAQQQLQIKAMLYGHIHTDRHQSLAHIDTWACPSTCWQWQHSSEFAVSDEAPGYRLSHLMQDGSIKTQVYRTGGNICVNKIY